ncbi:hypothetical protein [Streptomyces tauricus]|uniref:hypothetical protein n=1 Tax=Streptomyces tauricus TaxID=68274 RepID=UPI002244295E|nr:hypothetical protein [Streptomyces tauricus]MCW8103242.1 hypothetical protein [Streptomyces tauricus]
MTTHQLKIRTTYAQTTDRHGRPKRALLGKVTTCTCGLATGSAPGGLAERAYAEHRATISSDQEPTA